MFSYIYNKIKSLCCFKKSRNFEIEEPPDRGQIRHTIKISQKLITFFTEQTKELDPSSKELLKLYKGSLSGSYIFNARMSIPNINDRKGVKIFSKALIKVFLDNISPIDQTVTSEAIYLAYWSYFFRFPILEYAYLVFAGEDIYNEIKKVCIQFHNCFHLSRINRNFFLQESLYKIIAENDNTHFVPD